MSSLLPLIVRLAAPLQKDRDLAKALLLAAGEASVDPLIAALAHPQKEIRSGAALTLGELGAEAAVEQLSRMATTDPEPDLRPLAVRALSDLASPSSGSPLIIALLDQLKADDKFSRALACRGLGRVATPPCRKALELALGDRDDWVRQAAQQALGTASDSNTEQPDGPPEGHPASMIAADDALAALVSQLASLEIASQRQAQQALVDHGAAAVARVASLLWDPMATTRRAAAETLGLIGAAEGLGPLGRLLDLPDTPRALAAVAMHAMSRIVDRCEFEQTDAMPQQTIRELCADPDPSVRGAALGLAIRLGRELRGMALDRLVEQEDDEWVEGLALEALASGVSPADRPILGRLVDALGRYVEPESQLLVLQAIHRIVGEGPTDSGGQDDDNQRLVGPTSFFLRSEQRPEVRLAALGVLGAACQRLDAAGLQDVLQILRDLPESGPVALGLIARAAPAGSAAAAEGIRHLLAADDELARQTAEVLGAIGGRVAVEALVEVANSQRGPVVAAAAQTLARLDRDGPVIAVRGPDGRWGTKLQLRCACDGLVEWVERDGREELRCVVCDREHVLGPTAKLYDAGRTPLGTCLCCPRKQLLIRGDDEGLLCPVTGEGHVRPFDAPAELRRVTELPLGVCGCCSPPQPLERVEDRVLCHRTGREHLAAERGFAPASPVVEVADDVAAINAALLDGTLGIGQSGVPTLGAAETDDEE